MALKVLKALPLLYLPLVGADLDPDCAPGGNFDLSVWSLLLPTGTIGRVDTIKSSALLGCSGYTGRHFRTDKTTGEMVLTAPGDPDRTGCATTLGSSHCRTQLREVKRNNGLHTEWSALGTNILKMTLTVPRPDDGTHGTSFCQMYGASSSQPLVEMYFSRLGDIAVAIRPSNTRAPVVTKLAALAAGMEFKYELSYSKEVLSVKLNGKKTRFNTDDWEAPSCYFAFGNSNEGRSTASSEVRIASISVTHY